MEIKKIDGYYRKFRERLSTEKQFQEVFGEIGNTYGIGSHLWRKYQLTANMGREGVIIFSTRLDVMNKEKLLCTLKK